jgi:hypothetical protein
MRKLQALFLVAIVLFLGGCTPMAEQVMPPLQYEQPVNFNVAKKAYLDWEVGKQYSSTQPVFISASGGLLGAVIATAIDSEERNRNPGRYTFTYGKAQQAVFMTSLKDTLEKNHTFNHIELTTEPQQVRAEDVLITIYFKRTRVASAQDNYKIILDADFLIKTGGKIAFKRTYFVESKPGGLFSPNNFKEQQTDVSQQLLGKVIAGIQAWHTQTTHR